MEKTKFVSENDTSDSKQREKMSAGARQCRQKFLRFFPKGFYDEKYIAWERGYKWQAHERWNDQLNRAEFRSLLKRQEFSEIARIKKRIE